MCLLLRRFLGFVFFFFNDTATTEIYTLSLHDALPILHERSRRRQSSTSTRQTPCSRARASTASVSSRRSEEHTSELQSPDHLVCRLLLEKKKNTQISGSLVQWCLHYYLPVDYPLLYAA